MGIRRVHACGQRGGAQATSIARLLAPIAAITGSFLCVHTLATKEGKSLAIIKRMSRNPVWLATMVQARSWGTHNHIGGAFVSINEGGERGRERIE